MAEPPRIAAASVTERATLGYLHANCANCHHANAGRVPLRLNLMQRVTEPGKMAGWIAPPARGINNQPVDFDYVRFA